MIVSRSAAESQLQQPRLALGNPHADVGPVLADGEAVASLGIDVQFEGNLLLVQRVGEDQGVAHGHDFVGGD